MHDVRKSETLQFLGPRPADTRKLIESKRPNVIFLDYELGGSRSLELLDLHASILPNPPVKAVFLVSSKDTNALASTAAEQGTDSVLIKPFTFQSLRDEFIRVMKNKTQPSPYHKAVHVARDLFERNNRPEDALKAVALAKKLDKKPTLACYYEGRILFTLGKFDDALKSFDEGIGYSQTHFRCLCGRMDVLMKQGKQQEAYDVARVIADNHTIPLSRISDFIRLSILNRKYDDALQFSSLVDDVQQVDESLAHHLSAGLVVCGLYLLKQHDKKNALIVFRRAEIAAKGQTKILKRLVCAYVEGDLDEEFKTMIMRMPEEVQNSMEVRVAELRALERKGKRDDVIRRAMEMIQAGMVDQELFRIAIRFSVALQRRRETIEDLVWKASKAFPEQKTEFEQLLPPEPESKSKPELKPESQSAQ
jgi:tetratricopeptide (TPR) repeat protein